MTKCCIDQDEDQNAVLTFLRPIQSPEAVILKPATLWDNSMEFWPLAWGSEELILVPAQL